jgi:hypothetical protein
VANVAIKARPTLKTWHHHLSHVNVETVLDMARRNAVTSMDADLSHIPAKCADYVLGKQKKKPVRKRRKGPRSTRKLQKVFADLAGPQAVVPRGGYLFTLQLINDYSHEQWTILLRKKSDATQQLKEWIAIVEAESGKKVGIFRVDLGTEFNKAGFIHYLREHGIRKETSALYSSAQMGPHEPCPSVAFVSQTPSQHVGRDYAHQGAN